MSASMCCAESLTPIGMPPERSRTSSAKRRKSSTPCQSGNVGGDTAGVPSGRPRTSAMRPTTFGPGQVAAGAGLRALAELEVERLHLLQRRPTSSRTAPTRARRSSASSRPAPRAACRPRPSRCRCPRAARRARARSSPPARARRTTCRRRTAGCRGRAAGARSGRCTPRCRPRRRRAAASGASCAVTNWMSSHLGSCWRGTPIAATEPCADRSRPFAASSWIRMTYGSSVVPCGSSNSLVVGGGDRLRAHRPESTSSSSTSRHLAVDDGS